MKKILLFVLCTTMIFSVALYGCNRDIMDGNDDTTAPETETLPPETTAPENTEPEVTQPEETQPDGVTPATDLSGSLEEIYKGITVNTDIDLGMTYQESFGSDMATSYTGLTAEEMNQYVEEALASNAMISANAHLVVLLRCTDDAAALEVKTLIAESFDSGRWICVFPDKSVVVEAGNYVLLVSSREESVDALVNGFAALAGNDMGEPDVFFTGM